MNVKKMQFYQGLVTDIDGTLVKVAIDALPSERVKQSIKKAVEAGKTIVLATGRPYFLIEELVKLMNLQGYAITDNGAAINALPSGETVWEVGLTADQANLLLPVFSEAHLVRASTNLGPRENPDSLEPELTVRKISVHDLEPALAESYLQLVAQDFPQLVGVKAASYMGSHLTDIYFAHKEATKWHAVRKLAELIGVEPSQLIGAGDGHNDAPLLEACGLKVAMGNAVDELKELADEVVGSVDDDGLAWVIENFLLNEIS